MDKNLSYIILTYCDLEVILTYCANNAKLRDRLLKVYRLPTLYEAINCGHLKSVQYLLSLDDCLNIKDYELSRKHPQLFEYLDATYMVNCKISWVTNTRLSELK